MLHSDKSAANQSAFGEHFAEIMKTVVPKEKRIPSFLADQERALRSFVQVMLEVME
jgi:hypothetical protein